MFLYRSYNPLPKNSLNEICLIPFSSLVKLGGKSFYRESDIIKLMDEDLSKYLKVGMSK